MDIFEIFEKMREVCPYNCTVSVYEDNGMYVFRWDIFHSGKLYGQQVAISRLEFNATVLMAHINKAGWEIRRLIQEQESVKVC